MNNRYSIYCDVETGGLNSTQHVLTEIALITFHMETDGKKIILIEDDFYNEIIKPKENMNFTTKALEIQDRTIEFLNENGKEEEKIYPEVVKYLLKWLGTYVKDWAGQIWAHNADFDHAFMYEFAKRNRIYNDKEYISNRCDWNCTKNYFRLLKFLGYHDRWAASLNKVIEHYNIQVEGVAHGALRDARVGVKALECMINEFHFGTNKLNSLNMISEQEEKIFIPSESKLEE